MPLATSAVIVALTPCEDAGKSEPGFVPGWGLSRKKDDMKGFEGTESGGNNYFKCSDGYKEARGKTSQLPAKARCF